MHNRVLLLTLWYAHITKWFVSLSKKNRSYTCRFNISRYAHSCMYSEVLNMPACLPAVIKIFNLEIPEGKPAGCDVYLKADGTLIMC